MDNNDQTNEKTSELIKDLELVKNKMENQIQALNNNTGANGTNAAGDISVTADYLKQKTQSSFITDAYKSNARAEGNNVWIIRAITVIFIMVATVLSYLFFIPLFQGGENIGIFTILINFIPFGFVIILIMYLIMIERKQTKVSLRDKDFGLKISLLDAYLKEIPREDADMIKVELSRYLFGSLNDKKE